MNRYEAYRYAEVPLRRRRGSDRQMFRAAITCFTGALLLLVAMIFANCGTTTIQKINAANTAARGLTNVIRPLMDGNCASKARACKAANDTTCKPWVGCRDKRRAYYDAINAVHIAAAEAAVFAALDEKPQLEAVLKQCLEALSLAKKLAGAAGFK